MINMKSISSLRIIFLFSLLISIVCFADNTISELTRKANSGDASAQYRLGKIYNSTKYNQPRDSAKALYWWNIAAKNGNLDAKLILGALYEHGHLIEKEKKDTILYIKTLKFPYIKKDIQTAISLYKECAISDNYPWAQYHLGNIFYNGEEVEQDYKQAVMYYKRAANNNKLDKSDRCVAMNRLSICYRYGRGVEPDSLESIHWREQAALNGFIDAMDITGLGVYGTVFYEDGTPLVPKGEHILVMASVHKKSEESNDTIHAIPLIFFSKDKGSFKLPPELQDETLILEVSDESYYPIEFIGKPNLKLTLKSKY